MKALSHEISRDISFSTHPIGNVSPSPISPETGTENTPLPPHAPSRNEGFAHSTNNSLLLPNPGRSSGATEEGDQVQAQGMRRDEEHSQRARSSRVSEARTQEEQKGLTRTGMRKSPRAEAGADGGAPGRPQGSVPGPGPGPGGPTEAAGSQAGTARRSGKLSPRAPQGARRGRGSH